MTPGAAPHLHDKFGFAATLPAGDRDRLLMQLMASVWDNILQLPAQSRDTAESDFAKPTDLPLLSAGGRITGGWEGLMP